MKLILDQISFKHYAIISLKSHVFVFWDFIMELILIFFMLLLMANGIIHVIINFKTSLHF